MKRMVVGVLVVVLMLVVVGTTAGAASSPTMAQFKDLKRQVNRLQNRVEKLEAAPTDACLSTINVAVFDDYEQYPDSGPITALDIDNAAPDWRVVTRIC
jgi:hypothetical protein